MHAFARSCDVLKSRPLSTWERGVVQMGTEFHKLVCVWCVRPLHCTSRSQRMLEPGGFASVCACLCVHVRICACGAMALDGRALQNPSPMHARCLERRNWGLGALLFLWRHAADVVIMGPLTIVQATGMKAHHFVEEAPYEEDTTSGCNLGDCLCCQADGFYLLLDL